MIKQSIIKIITLIQHLKWRIEVLTLPKLSIDVPEFKMTSEDRLLIIAPHADDELIGCHALMNRYNTKTKVFYCSFLGHNYNEKNQITRQKEFSSYMNSLGINFDISKPENLSVDLYNNITDFKPTIIALPSYIDWHPEHRLINEILTEINIQKMTDRILWYHISLPIPGPFINKCLLMNEEQYYGKWEAMRTFYKSQLNMDIERFMFVESIYSKKRQALETFMLLETDKWKEIINVLGNKGQELGELKNTLGNITKMLKETESIYKIIQ